MRDTAAFSIVTVGDLTCDRAEHSTYLTALRSQLSFSAAFLSITIWFFWASPASVDGSLRRSIWVPTSKNGVLGQWWVISGTHWRKEKDNTKRQANTSKKKSYKSIRLSQLCQSSSTTSHRILWDSLLKCLHFVTETAKRTRSRTERWQIRCQMVHFHLAI